MKILKYFTFFIWIVLCAIVAQYLIPSDWRLYIWGFVAGSVALFILNVFDLFIEKI